jgi:uncharacterized protein YbjT (DUF2867 family)
MKILLFGATGMVGQGVLHECLAARDVERVITVGRTGVGQSHLKLEDIVQADLYAYSNLEDRLRGIDACFFCLGVSSLGMNESDYSRVTYDITVAAAQTLSRLNPRMTFVFVSGAGTDSSEQGRSMWARVKGKAENALLRLPFKAVYLFRPGAIKPLHGQKSKTPMYRLLISVFGPLFSLLHWLLPNTVLSTGVIGQAMLNVARRGAPQQVMYARDINAAAQ